MRRMLELLESRVSSRTTWHFVVLTEGEHRAVGECSDSGDPRGLVRRLDWVAAVLRGRDLIADRDAVIAELEQRVGQEHPREAFSTATLMGGLEQLLTDHAARTAEEPAWKWLGGSTPDPVPVYANINRMPGGRSAFEVAAMAEAAVAAGFTALKCGPFDVDEPGRPLSKVGLERLRAVRDAVGDETRLHVDCHERLPLDEVHALLPALEELGVAWLEDAVAIDQVTELAELKAATEIPLAGGETMFDAAEARGAVTDGVIDVLMPDVKHAGGIEHVLRIARSVPHLAISPHNPSGPVATAASAQLFAACSNATVLEYAFGETTWRSDLVGGCELVADGRLQLDDRPGLGVDFDLSHPSLRVLWSALV
jgi:galactonate dehydratase